MRSISNKSMRMNTKRGKEEINHKALNARMRATSQRALILEISQQETRHLDVDELYLRARERQPRLSLSTVYRSLQTFKKLGLVDETHFDENHHHYEVKQPPEHHHLICLGCGRVIEFRYQLARYVKRNIAEAKDFEIVDTEIRMTGYCPACRQAKR